MRKFEEKPAVIEAEQWDGTIRGVDKIRKLVESCPRPIDFTVKTEYVSNGEPWSCIEFSEVTAGYIRDRQSNRMREGDWLIRTWNDQIQILDDDTFHRLYKEVSGA